METTERDSASQEAWHVLAAKARVDALNHEALERQLRAAQTAGKTRIGIDLHATRFLSQQAIRFITQFAEQLAESGGRLALIAPAEKTKRHFEIYGSLERILVFRAGETFNIVSQEELSARSGGATLASAVSVLIADTLGDDGLDETGPENG